MDNFAYLMWRILKALNENSDADRLSVGVARFVVI